MTNVEQYNKLIESVKLKKVDLYSMNCYRNELSDYDDSEFDVRLDSGVANEKINGKELIVECEFALKVANDSEQKEMIFGIEFILQLKYEFDLKNESDIFTLLNSKNSEELISAFIERNVPVNVWPYAREIISSTTTKMGFPPIIIPPYIGTKY